MTFRRTLLAAALAAAALAPVPSALASCHWCGLGVECPPCGPLYDLIENVESESRSRTGDAHCQTVETATGSLVHCH